MARALATFSAVIVAFGFCSTATGAGDPTFLAKGVSDGAGLRAGPGLDFPETGRTERGDTVDIVGGTGLLLNDFEWVEVRRGSDGAAYHWGGSLCSLRDVPVAVPSCSSPDGQSSPSDPERIPQAVRYPGGSFVREMGEADWVERNASGVYEFAERRVMNDLVVLFDEGRDINIVLNLRTAEVLLGAAGGGMRPIYSITDIVY